MRPGPRRPCAISKPRPSPSSRFEAGTRTFSSSTWAWPCGASSKPNTGSIFSTLMPGVSSGTRICDCCWCLAALGSVLPIRIAILMGKTDPSAAKHQQQSQILVPLDTPGIKVEKMLPVFGFDDAPHGHAQVLLENVRVPAGNILLGEGRGFEIAQGRLGPGRIHHCMRTIGKAEEALEKMVKRLMSRTAFGKKIIEHSVWEQRIGEARTNIEMTRLLCLKAADMMDKVGNKTAQAEIAMIKVTAPNMALRIIDNAIQAYGGVGVTEDAGLARDYASMRTMRLADGPDEVHNRAIARLELRKYANSPTH